MRKMLFGMLVVVCLLAGVVSANKPPDADEEGVDRITVSPNVLILGKPGSSFSIHSNIAYSSLDLESLVLTADGVVVDPFSDGADNQGDLVIKVRRQVIQDIAEVGSMTITLTGVKNDGSDIDDGKPPEGASDTITVKQGGKKQEGQG